MITLGVPIAFQVSALIPLAEESELPAGSIPPVAFAVTALFALAVFALGWDLVRRVRRNQYRAEIREALAEEVAQRDAAASSDAAGGPRADAPGRDAGPQPDPGAPSGPRA
ncbi:hypothetical protein [Leucobacter weissii]|uniref:hypothetical protein n=1 Tax=Leucobacter weissii TaxID=1983706 RepID=UPI001FB746A6|nr:hypothetical protein [Leucobacter weissii]